MNRQRRRQRLFTLWIRRGRGEALPCFLLSVGYKGKDECSSSSTKPEWANGRGHRVPRATTTQHLHIIRAPALVMHMLRQVLREVAGVWTLGACVQALCAWEQQQGLRGSIGTWTGLEKPPKTCRLEARRPKLPKTRWWCFMPRCGGACRVGGWVSGVVA